MVEVKSVNGKYKLRLVKILFKDFNACPNNFLLLIKMERERKKKEKLRYNIFLRISN